jgi:transposase-like protein
MPRPSTFSKEKRQQVVLVVLQGEVSVKEAERRFAAPRPGDAARA